MNLNSLKTTLLHHNFFLNTYAEVFLELISGEIILLMV